MDHNCAWWVVSSTADAVARPDYSASPPDDMREEWTAHANAHGLEHLLCRAAVGTIAR